MEVTSEYGIYETKNIGCRHYAIEIHSNDATSLLGFRDSARVRSIVKQNFNFLR